MPCRRTVALCLAIELRHRSDCHCCLPLQCAKLLGDMSVPQFYPAMFAVVSDILDSFGKLVFERLRGRIAETSQLQGDTPFTTAGALRGRVRAGARKLRQHKLTPAPSIAPLCRCGLPHRS